MPEGSILTDDQIILDALRKIVRSLRYFSKTTEKDFGLSTAQIFVLQKLYESERPLSINEVAAATLTHQSSVSVVVSKLVQRKLIKRSAREGDARSVELSLTKEGKYLLTKSPTSIQEQFVSGLAKMTLDERRGLVVGLQRFIQETGLQSEIPSMLMEDIETLEK